MYVIKHSHYRTL